MKNYDFELNYKSGGRELTLRKNCDGEGEDDVVENKEISLLNVVEEFEGGKSIRVVVTPKRHLMLKNFNLRLRYIYPKNSKVFCNGFQSWTDTREYFCDESMKGISPVMKALEGVVGLQHFGDYKFVKYAPKEKGVFHSFSYTYMENEGVYTLMGSLSERTGYTIFKHRTEEQRVAINKDCDGVVLDAGKEYELLNIILFRGQYDEVFDKYFKMLNLPKLKEKRRTGYTTWYNHYTNISQQIVEENLAAIKSSGAKIDIFQVDDGYQTATGDWLSTDRKKFPEGMKACADAIKKEGYIPGLWLAPFSCCKSSEVYKNHKDWLIKDEKGVPFKVGASWGGCYVLDIYNPDAAEYIKQVFDVVLNQWGYGLVKLDFLYQEACLPRKGKSRGQIMCEAMDFLRDCVGDKLILGCGVPLMPAFGKVDFCRIGSDIALTWDGASAEKLMHRERVSTKNAIADSIFRRHLDGRAFVNDPDVFMLRSENNSLTAEQKHMLAKVNRLFGNLLFTSDNIANYDDKQMAEFKEVLEPFNGKINSVVLTKPYNIEIKYTENKQDKLLVLDMVEGKIKEEV